MNSQKTHKNTLYPEDFNEDDKLNYDILFNQSNYSQKWLEMNDDIC